MRTLIEFLMDSPFGATNLQIIILGPLFIGAVCALYFVVEEVVSDLEKMSKKASLKKGG